MLSFSNGESYAQVSYRYLSHGSPRAIFVPIRPNDISDRGLPSENDRAVSPKDSWPFT